MVPRGPFGLQTAASQCSAVHPQKPVEHFGKEASAFTRSMAEGKRVRLEYEVGASTQDRYGRTLAYVYLEDGTLLNLAIINGGYGFAYTKYPFSRMDEFRAAQRRAREAGIGLWDRSDGGESPRRSTSPQAPTASGAASCIPAEQCCKVCRKGKACGNTCISRSYTCRKGVGCACDSATVCR